MIDSTRIRGEFICKGVVNGGREYGGGCVGSPSASFLFRSLSLSHRSRSFLRVFRNVLLLSSNAASSSVIYDCPCFSRTVFSSLFDVMPELSKDKRDVSVAPVRFLHSLLHAVPPPSAPLLDRSPVVVFSPSLSLFAAASHASHSHNDCQR